MSRWMYIKQAIKHNIRMHSSYIFAGIQIIFESLMGKKTNY